MTQSNDPDFLDVPELLELSQPAPRARLTMPIIASFLLLVVVSAWLSTRSAGWKQVVDAVSGLVMIGIGITMALVMAATVRRQREERAQLESVEELVQLRRWPEAASMLRILLSRPTRSPFARIQLLIYLATVLARYNRFDDAIAVQNHLLDNVRLDPSTAHALRLGRAMAMLRQDHLFDADRAINELRRDMNRVADAIERAKTEAAEEVPPATDALETIDGDGLSPDAPIDPAPLSAGLSLVEIYRDVKTGHPEEAIAMFERALPTMRKQLGHRIADGYALAARAYDFLGKTKQAQEHWDRATLLSPIIELVRRYPELSAVAEKYVAAAVPSAA